MQHAQTHIYMGVHFRYAYRGGGAYTYHTWGWGVVWGGVALPMQK